MNFYVSTYGQYKLLGPFSYLGECVEALITGHHGVGLVFMMDPSTRCIYQYSRVFIENGQPHWYVFGP